ncbi:MAG: 50S ribosomal protein L17 [Candidatus Nealsonbacteria bacterium]|nr:50S ribosomal protein L17 [Candidatus Nealsonbacteria bacterium]
MQKKGRKLSRKKDQRKALLRALVSALVLHEKIKTTETKAKEARSSAEKSITLAKRSTLLSRRLLARFFSPKIVKKMIEELGPRYKDRPGGYTRIIKLGPRLTDGAKMAIIELVK